MKCCFKCRQEYRARTLTGCWTEIEFFYYVDEHGFVILNMYLCHAVQLFELFVARIAFPCQIDEFL